MRAVFIAYLAVICIGLAAMLALGARHV